MNQPVPPPSPPTVDSQDDAPSPGRVRGPMTAPRARFLAVLASCAVVAGVAALAFSNSRDAHRLPAIGPLPAPELHPLSAAPISPASPAAAEPRNERVGSDGKPPTCVLQDALSEDQLLAVLAEGHLAQFGTPPPPKRLACAFAHCALEHGRGTRLFGNNLGHVTTAGGWAGRSCLHSWTERRQTNPDRWEVIQLRFRVHDSLLDGAIDYWKLMGSNYRPALDACDAGDAEKAGQLLGALGYYTSDADSYAEAMKGLFVTARKRIAANGPASAPVLPGGAAQF